MNSGHEFSPAPRRRAFSSDFSSVKMTIRAPRRLLCIFSASFLLRRCIPSLPGGSCTSSQRRFFSEDAFPASRAMPMHLPSVVSSQKMHFQPPTRLQCIFPASFLLRRCISQPPARLQCIFPASFLLRRCISNLPRGSSASSQRRFFSEDAFPASPRGSSASSQRRFFSEDAFPAMLCLSCASQIR